MCFGLGTPRGFDEERANEAMQRTREQAGRFWNAFSASR